MQEESITMIKDGSTEDGSIEDGSTESSDSMPSLVEQESADTEWKFGLHMIPRIPTSAEVNEELGLIMEHKAELHEQTMARQALQDAEDGCWDLEGGDPDVWVDSDSDDWAEQGEREYSSDGYPEYHM